MYISFCIIISCCIPDPAPPPSPQLLECRSGRKLFWKQWRWKKVYWRCLGDSVFVGTLFFLGKLEGWEIEWSRRSGGNLFCPLMRFWVLYTSIHIYIYRYIGWWRYHPLWCQANNTSCIFHMKIHDEFSLSSDFARQFLHIGRRVCWGFTATGVAFLNRASR